MACSGPDPPLRDAFGRCERGARKGPSREHAKHPAGGPPDRPAGTGPQFDRVDAAKGRRRQASAPDRALEAKRRPSEPRTSLGRGAVKPHFEPPTGQPAHSDRGLPSETRDGRICGDDRSTGPVGEVSVRMARDRSGGADKRGDSHDGWPDRSTHDSSFDRSSVLLATIEAPVEAQDFGDRPGVCASRGKALSAERRCGFSAEA